MTDDQADELHKRRNLQRILEETPMRDDDDQDDDGRKQHYLDANIKN